MTDRDFILIALVMYVGAFLYALYLLQGRGHWTSRGHVILVAAGWLLHTYGLYARAVTLGRCPVTNLFETMMFVNWALVGLYLIVGMTKRVSLLGTFTLPLVILIGTFGYLAPMIDQRRTGDLVHSAWLSMHASLSLLGYGAWGLAGVSGVMYLVQERQLKSRRLRGLFMRLPSIEQLDVINYRLLLVGFALLLAGTACGFVLGLEFLTKDVLKTVWTLLVVAVYGALIGARLTYRLRGRKIALGSISLFVLLLATFWSVNMLSAAHRF